MCRDHLLHNLLIVSIYTDDMDTLETKAIKRILHSCRSQNAVHVSDVVAGLRIILPDRLHDEAAIIKHLIFMVENGYELPVPLLLT